jgi:hypothetical protein
MMRLLSILAIVAVVMAAAYGSAATLGVSGGAIQAGADTSLYCDPDGVVANWGLETNDNTVRYVRITGIHGACQGNELFAKVLGEGDALLASGKALLDTSGEVKFSFSAPYLDPAQIVGLKLWIEGPNGQ